MGDQPGPTALVRGTHASARVAVEVFVEERVVAEVRIERNFGFWILDFGLVHGVVDWTRGATAL